MIKSKTKLVLIISSVLCVLIICGILFSDSLEITAANDDASPELSIEVISTSLDGKIMIEGDCFIITYGDIEILVDAAKDKPGTFDKIKDSMTKVMEEDPGKVWDYVIFTHQDDDHIGCYDGVLSLFETDWELGNIIDFDVYPDDLSYIKLYTYTANKYRDKRQKLVDNGCNYFSAATLKPDNLTKKYSLSQSNDLNCDLYILYNYYDDLQNISEAINEDGKFDTDEDSTNKNLMSVCFMIIIGDQKILFTGDISKKGEEKLVEYHKDFIKNVTFFKAGHHGSQGGNEPRVAKSSNSEQFVDHIKPAYVSITSKNGVISDKSIEYFLKYTGNIFPSYVYMNELYYKMYGNQKFWFNGDSVSVETDLFSKEDDIIPIYNAELKKKDGEYCNWFIECVDDTDRHINDKLYIYTFDDVIDKEVQEDTEQYNCTLIKYGSIDILIDCGSSKENSDAFVNKLKDYVVDGKIDYIITTHNKPYCLSQIAGNYTVDENGKRTVYRKGIIDSFEVGYIVDNYHTNITEIKNGSCLFRYRNLAKTLEPNRTTMKNGDKPFVKTLTDNPYGLKLTVLSSLYPDAGDENNYSMTVIVEFYGKKALFVGDLANYEKLITGNNADKIKNVDFFRMSNCGDPVENMKGFSDFAKTINPRFVMLGTPLYYTIDGLGKQIFDKKDQIALKNLFKCNIYYLGYDNVDQFGNSYYYPDNGDLVYYMSYSHGQIPVSDVQRVDKVRVKTLK